MMTIVFCKDHVDFERSSVKYIQRSYSIHWDGADKETFILTNGLL